MPRFLSGAARAALIGLAAGAFALAGGAVAQTASGAKTVILVHGALADASSWNRIIPLLQAKGLKVVAVQNPLTSLADDVAATERAIAAESGPVVLVGHSWGGVVITQAGSDPKVTGLVFVAALAPDAGQSANDMLAGQAPAPGSAEFRKDAAGFISVTAKGMAEDFAQDLPASDTAVMAVTQAPIAGTCFDDKVSKVAWKTKPSWYIVATQDRMLAPAFEKAMAEHIRAVTSSLPASHAVLLSKPAEVAQVIAEAAAAK